MTDIEALRARMREAAEKAKDGERMVDASGLLFVRTGPLERTGIAVMETSDEAEARFLALASPANVKALDAYTTRLREDLDRVTRERDAQYDENVSRIAAEGAAILRAEAAEAALAKRDEEVARLRVALIQSGRNAGALLTDEVSNDFLMHIPNQVEGRIKALASKIEDLTKEPPPNAE